MRSGGFELGFDLPPESLAGGSPQDSRPGPGTLVKPTASQKARAATQSDLDSTHTSSAPVCQAR